MKWLTDDTSAQTLMDRPILPPLQHTPPTATHSSIFSVFPQFSESHLSPSVFLCFLPFLAQLTPFLSFLGHVRVFWVFPLFAFLSAPLCPCLRLPAGSHAAVIPVTITQDQTTTMLLCLKDTLKESVLQLLRNNHKHTGTHLSSAALINIITNYPVTRSAHMNSYYNNEL